MTASTLTIRKKAGRRVTVEVNIDAFERLAANLGFFNPEFLRSLDRAEEDIGKGKIEKISSLQELQ